MTLLESTLALAVMSGVLATTLEMADEVELRHAEYQAAQTANFEKIKRIRSHTDKN